MKRLFLCFVLATGWAHAASGPDHRIHRLALLVGSNHGGSDRPLLRYARSDVASVRAVMLGLGGVAEEDLFALTDPHASELSASLQKLAGRIRSLNAPGLRTELFFYYSGHSDERGLWLDGALLPYSELHQLLRAIPASFEITVLDSCASGAFTQLKGGKLAPSFLVDASSDVSGHAVLTSSSAGEASQESDSIGGSFFTHHLVSGLRGAADLNHDGKVTLEEVYQFAFKETLARTEQTQAGAQHPAYGMQVAGTGDVVLTDLRTTQARLELPRSLEGHLFVRDAKGNLVVELDKAAGLPLALGLEAGGYELTLMQRTAVFQARTTLARGESREVSPALFHEVTRELTTRRGGFIDHPPDVSEGHWTVSALVGASFASGEFAPSAELQLMYRFTNFGLGVDVLSALPLPDSLPGGYGEGTSRFAALASGYGLVRAGITELSLGAGVGPITRLPFDDGRATIAFGLQAGLAVPLSPAVDFVGHFSVVISAQDAASEPGAFATLGAGIRVRFPLDRGG